MKTSESQSNLVAALFGAKQKFPAIAKNKRGQAGNRSFNYAPLDAIMEHIDPVLYANGLMLTQGTDGHTLVTRLEHAPSGEWRETHMPVNAEHANMQSYGIELTYRRRYAYQMILGIVTEEDIDIKERSKRSGVDHTDPRNDNGTLQGSGAISPRKLIFDGLQPDVQTAIRRAVPQVEAAMPDAEKATDVIMMVAEEWTEHAELNDIKAGFAYLLLPATSAALKRHSQAVNA